MQSDDHRARLETLRDDLTRAMKRAPVSVKPQYAGQLRQVLKDLAGLPEASTEVSKADLSSPVAEPVGRVEPQILHRPPDVVSLDAARDAIELADWYGVAGGHRLDESQRLTLEVALGMRVDESWAATTVCDFEPRQNGKNDTIAARELAGVILFGERLLIHTAHEFATANESFLRLIAVFEAWDDLRAKVGHIRYANGAQAIEMLSGARILYRARTGGSVRGFARADLVVYDEAQHLKAEHVAASGPARLVNPNSQSWYAGSGGLESSSNSWRFRRRALERSGDRLAYVEHTAEQVTLVDGKVKVLRPDVLDREAWAQANPAYGHRISDDSLHGLYLELGEDLFARECLCMWDPEPGVEEGPLSVVVWDALVDGQSKIAGPVKLALDISPDGRWSSFAVAGRRADGLGHVELRDRKAGTDWVVERAGQLSRGHGTSLVVDPKSPAGALLGEFEAAGVAVDKMTETGYAQACGALVIAVTDAKVRHLEQPPLRAAIVAARQRKLTDAWAWSRINSQADITPLVAATLAWSRVPAAKPVNVTEHVF